MNWTGIIAGVLMGGTAVLSGYVFRNKTKRAKFGVPLIVLNIVIAVAGVKHISYAITDTPKYQKITPETAKEMMDSSGAVILDVRTAGEYEGVHIPNAVLLPDTDVEQLAESLLPDKKQTILVYCRTGRRSKNTAEVLIEMGYTQVYDFGGIVDWPYEVVWGE